MINQRTHDLFGNEIDSLDWEVAISPFEDALHRFRESGDQAALALAERLMETVDDIPGQIAREYEATWRGVDDGLLPGPQDAILNEMIDSLAHGYAPANATEFLMEFVARITGAKPS